MGVPSINISVTQYAHTRTDDNAATTEMGMYPASMSLARRWPARYVVHGWPPGGGAAPSTTTAVPRMWNSVTFMSARWRVVSTTPMTPWAPTSAASSTMRV